MINDETDNTGRVNGVFVLDALGEQTECPQVGSYGLNKRGLLYTGMDF